MPSDHNHHHPAVAPPPRLLLLASNGYQSLVTLRELLAQGLAPVAIGLAGDPRHAPATSSLGGVAMRTDPVLGELEALAQRHHIAVLDGRPSALLAVLDNQPPTLILASCYPYQLPQALSALPQRGSFNLHPSALPDYRGPSPIFWQLRDGVREPAVSVHRMSERLDAGDLLWQQRMSIADGTDYAGWVEQLTIAGVRGFLQRLPDWLDGRIDLRPQTGPGSYQGWPQPSDFVVDPHWSRQRTNNFVRGCRALGTPLLQGPDGRTTTLRVDE